MDLVTDAYGRARTLKDVRFGDALPEGYEIRFPTEAELEYAISEGGLRPLSQDDVYHDLDEMKRSRSDNRDTVNPEWYREFRVFPNAVINGWGLTSGWIQSEQVVADRIGLRKDLVYAAEETDPVRFGKQCILRQNYNARLIVSKPEWVVSTFRLCIGPKLKPISNSSP